PTRRSSIYAYSPWSTLNDHTSLSDDTGPCCECWRCPSEKYVDFIQASKSSCARQRVYTRYRVPSDGRKSSNASKPGACETCPARLAKRSSNSPARSAGTVTALTTTIDMTTSRLDWASLWGRLLGRSAPPDRPHRRRDDERDAEHENDVAYAHDLAVKAERDDVAQRSQLRVPARDHDPI